MRAFYSYISSLAILDEKLYLPHVFLPLLWLSFLYLLYYSLWHKRLFKTHLVPSILAPGSISSIDKMFPPHPSQNTSPFPFTSLAFYDPFEMHCSGWCEKIWI